MNATEKQPEEKRPRMTLRVYTTTRDGRITQDRGTIHITAEEKPNPYALRDAWPPCQCPRHREPSDPGHR